MESRLLLTATPTDRPTLSSAVEINTIFNSNSFMPVLAQTKGTGSYAFPQWGFLEYGPASQVFNNTSAAQDINNVTFQLYNTANSGNFHPFAGSFSIYVIPNDTVSAVAGSGPLRFISNGSGTNGTGNTLVGANSLGTSTGGPETLGITGNASDWLVGTWSITTGLLTGYSTYIGSSTGSTSLGDGTAGTSAVLGSQARTAIANDLNTHSPLRWAVVANDLNFGADLEGNFSSNQPQLTIDYQPSAAVVETFKLEQAHLSIK